MIIEGNSDLRKVRDAAGGIAVSIIRALGGDGITRPTKEGSYSLVFKKPQEDPFNRVVTTGHEVMGHGRSLSLDRGDLSEHIDAIQTENLIRRMIGITQPNTGVNHGTEKNHGFFPEHSQLPDF